MCKIKTRLNRNELQTVSTKNLFIPKVYTQNPEELFDDEENIDFFYGKDQDALSFFPNFDEKIDLQKTENEEAKADEEPEDVFEETEETTETDLLCNVCSFIGWGILGSKKNPRTPASERPATGIWKRVVWFDGGVLAVA